MATCRVLRLDKDVWWGRDNRFVLRLDKIALDLARSPADLSQVTSMRLEIEGYALQVPVGEVYAGINWWDENLETGEVAFLLGLWAEQEAIPEGRYPARLVVFDALNPNGIVWISFANGELTLDIHTG